MAESVTYVLDALAAVHIVRGDAYGQELVNYFDLAERTTRPIISAATVGECLRIARRTSPVDSWERVDQPALQAYFSELDVMPLSALVQRSYAKIMALQDDKGALLSGPQGWVAAAAHAVGGTIITHSSDFAKCSLVTAEAIDRVPYFS